MKHGNGGYARGCRCEECRAGHREYAKTPKSRAKQNERQRRLRTENPEEARLLDRQRYAEKRRTQVLAARRLKAYGVTPEDVAALLTAQGGLCALCGTDEPGGRGDFHVDHDHATGRVRALLCHKCNVGLGHFDDDPARLLDAYAYLVRHRTLSAQIGDPMPSIEIADPA